MRYGGEEPKHPQHPEDTQLNDTEEKGWWGNSSSEMEAGKRLPRLRLEREEPSVQRVRGGLSYLGPQPAPEALGFPRPAEQHCIA